MKKTFALLAILFIVHQSNAQDWQKVETKNESIHRSENSMVAIGSKLYLFGGRGIKPLEVYDTNTKTWEKRGETPLEIHHFQAVVYDGEIYVLGALTGPFPHETPIPNILIYNPENDEWREGPEIPRKRGSAGCFVYNDKIYMVCGIIDGHWDGHVSWFDEFDPKTGEWRVLTDAPRPRDHINVVMIDDQLVVAAGRNSTHKTNHVFDLVIAETDVYDFADGQWKTADENIPTTRAGIASAEYRGKALFIGGEGPHHLEAHDEVEAFDPDTMSWEKLPSLNQGRHGTSAAKVGNKIYISSGVAQRGGQPELNSVESLE
ncbi:Kelch repeat-containing protein [Jiulongibacter sp. NS-SX5]|uniref:Kelch repeat-containing protein n=1 Tax=Jiulongibacter sp. NS-SX5 TaxID=3463854 RepID=UPI004059477E